jgi:hypothetical protein
MTAAKSQEFQNYARDCIRSATDPNASPALREQLRDMAKDWSRPVNKSSGIGTRQIDRTRPSSPGSRGFMVLG